MERDQALKLALEIHKRSREIFSKAHREGLAALERHDYQALSQAVEDEASAIAKHREAVQQLNNTIKAQDK
jgi:predicted translin family RNA/ssDNA-binding protein